MYSCYVACYGKITIYPHNPYLSDFSCAESTALDSRASGWAVIAGLLTVRPWILEGDLWQNNADWLLKTLLLWLLFDPILGTIWQLLINNRLRRQTASASLALHGTPNLPYVTRNSAAYRWLVFRRKIRRQSAAAMPTDIFVYLPLILK